MDLNLNLRLRPRALQRASLHCMANFPLVAAAGAARARLSLSPLSHRTHLTWLGSIAESLCITLGYSVRVQRAPLTKSPVRPTDWDSNCVTLKSTRRNVKASARRSPAFQISKPIIMYRSSDRPID
jgi:hypothetical protein